MAVGLICELSACRVAVATLGRCADHMSSSESGHSVSIVGDTQESHKQQSKSERLEKFCVKIHKCLALPLTECLSVAHHGSATRAMQKAKDLIMEGDVEVGSAARTLLLCTGILCSKRIHAGVETEATDDLLKTTMTLIFSLLVLCESGKQLPEDEYEEVTDVMRQKGIAPRRVPRGDELLLLRWKTTTLSAFAFPEAAGVSAVDDALCSDSNISRAALQEARHCNSSDAFPKLRSLAAIFFRCSSFAMMRSVMSSAGPVAPDANSFLTLDTFSMLGEVNNQGSEKLSALVSAAESEAGQAVLRDIILSFKLPLGVVGVRRTLLLSRESNLEATKNHTEILNLAHETAMRGAESAWSDDADEVHKVSAVLAGMAIILARDPESVRKGDAFAGRVNMPFLETKPPMDNCTRLGLIPSTDTWCVYKVAPCGTPTIQATKNGYDGFCEMALLFSTRLNV